MRRILRKIAENQASSIGDTSTLADPQFKNLIENQFLQENDRIATLVVFIIIIVISSFGVSFWGRVPNQPEFQSRRIAWR